MGIESFCGRTLDLLWKGEAHAVISAYDTAAIAKTMDMGTRCELIDRLPF